MQIRSLDGEDPLEVGRATHCSVQEPGGPQSVGSRRVGHGRVTKHAWPRSMGDVGSPTRDPAHSPCIGSQASPLDLQGSPGSAQSVFAELLVEGTIINNTALSAALHAGEVRNAGKQPPDPSLLMPSSALSLLSV